MKTPQTNRKSGGQRSPLKGRWSALLAILAGVSLAGRASAAPILTVTGTQTLVPTQFNLSAEGDLDWAKWGSYKTADYDHKAGVVSLIPNYTPTGSGSYGSYGGDNTRCNWIDGTVDQAQSNQGNAIWASGADTGYQLNIPASTTRQVLNLYVGCWEKTPVLVVSLSGGGTVAVTNVIPRTTTWRYTITFEAASAGQTLTVNYNCADPGLSYGNCTLIAATLSSASPLPLSVPQPTLSSGSPVNAGSTFTVLANPKGSGSTTNGQSAFAYQWQVDGGGGYVDIAGGTSNPLNATVASAGSYNYRVIVTNSVLGGAAVTSAPVALTVTTPTSTLGASGTALPVSGPPAYSTLDVNLTSEGVTDWGHWGIVSPTDYDYKNGSIGNFTQIGVDAAVPFTSTVSFSWTDATSPNNSIVATTSGVGLPVGNGFELNIPASTSDQLVYIYVGLNNARLNLTASLSDGSAPLFTDNPTTTSGTLRYAIAFKASSAGKTLKVRLTETARTANNGSLSLLSAALQPLPALSVSTLIADPGTTVLVNQPMVISLAPLDPQGAPPLSYVWQRDTGAGYVNLPDTGRSASFVAGSTLGTESCRVIITGSQGSVTSAPVVLTRTAATGTLKLIAVQNSPSAANLTQEGSLDWSHWGPSGTSAAFDQKAVAGTPVGLIGDTILLGPSTVLANFGSGVTYNWTDGTPTLVSTNNRGVYRYPAGSGFEIDVAAATTNRLLHVYFGSYQAPLHVEAYLSDNSAIKLIDETFAYSPGGSAWAKYSIQFAAGSPGQKLIFKVWFVAGGNVTFSAASLQGMPALTPGTISLSPTNVVAAGSSIALDVQGATGVPLLKYQWQEDSGSGYAAIPGATNAHVVTSAGAALGNKNYRVVVSDISGSVTSAPVGLTVQAATSTLAGNYIATTANMYFDLTAEGTLDWAKWTTAGLDQKSTLPGLISQYSLVGDQGATIIGFGGGFYFSWADGTPTPTGTDNNSGIYVVGVGNGFEVDAAASATERVFSIYFSSYQARVHVEATMSDNSAPVFIDESVFNPGGNISARYNFKYSSPTPGAVLKVRYWDQSGVNCTLWAASLKNYAAVVPGSVQVQPVGGGQLQLTWTAGSLLEAPTPNGPWTANGATSPYLFTPAGAQKFFRTVQAPF